MTIVQYNDSLDRVIKQLRSDSGDELIVKAGISALTLIKRRVQETGIDAKGKKFKPYSTKDSLVGSTSFLQKAAAERFFASKDLEWRTVGGSSGYAAMLSVSAGGSGSANEGKGVHLAILKGGYAKLRELQGRQTDHVDFSVTNNMWNDITLVSNKSDHRNGKAIIAAKQEIEKKKLEGNTKRRGDILDLNKEEITLLEKAYSLGVLNIFKENGL